VPAFGDGDAAGRPHVYFHHSGNRALRVGDWKIVSGSRGPVGSAEDAWALYDLAADRCEQVDRARERPEKRRELAEQWRQCEESYRTAPA
jgi:arylsulfatase